MTRLTAKRSRVPVLFSYQPIIGWNGRLPILGARTSDGVWCDDCVDRLPRGVGVWAVTQQDVLETDAPSTCPRCGYQFAKAAVSHA